MNPVDGYIIPLVDKKWFTSNAIEPFKLNKEVDERYFDWKKYSQAVELNMQIRGDSSQWQRALFVSSQLGKYITDLITEKKWLGPEATEGEMHYDLLFYTRY